MGVRGRAGERERVKEGGWRQGERKRKEGRIWEKGNREAPRICNVECGTQTGALPGRLRGGGRAAYARGKAMRRAATGGARGSSYVRDKLSGTEGRKLRFL
jgi:hypothetical protein